MPEKEFLDFELGWVSKYIDVPDLLVRKVPRRGLVEELDEFVLEEEETEDEAAEPAVPEYEYRLQGRLVNTSKHKLSEIKYDVSYYDSAGKFLGLTKSRFLEEDELDVEDHLPLDMRVEFPENTSRCVFNVRAKRTGLMAWLFWG